MINYVIEQGRLGSDPELKATPSGKYVCDFNLANNEYWTDKQGQKQENTYWFKVVVWGKVGENCAKFLKKGSEVIVQGKLVTRDWTDKEGNTRKTTEIQAKEVQFIGRKENESSTSNVQPPQRNKENSRDYDRNFSSNSITTDDIPF